jgi:CBS domain-containing protein
MSFPVSTVSSDTTMQQTAEMFRKEGFTGFPVVENGQISGIISRRDFKKLNNPEKLKSPVKAFMSKNVKTITPDTSPMEAVRLMVKYDIGRLPVVEDGEIIGIVTRSDTMIYFYDLLPE